MNSEHNKTSSDCGTKSTEAHGHGPTRRGIYLLPNLLTTGAMFSGFYAILASFSGKFEFAAVAVFVAMVFDGLDGRVARLTHTQSDFGVQYDSLSDMVSFGVAPAVLAYSWMLHDLGKLGWAAAFVYASCAALRLARFNVQVNVTDKRYFMGIPSPVAAALVAGLVWSGYDAEQGRALALLTAIITTLAGLLMVSGFRYQSFKELDLRGKVPFVVIFAIAMTFVVVTIDPPRILFLMAAAYCASAPVLSLLGKRRAKAESAAKEEAASAEASTTAASKSADTESPDSSGDLADQKKTD